MEKKKKQMYIFLKRLLESGDEKQPGNFFVYKYFSPVNKEAMK